MKYTVLLIVLALTVGLVAAALAQPAQQERTERAKQYFSMKTRVQNAKAMVASKYRIADAKRSFQGKQSLCTKEQSAKMMHMMKRMQMRSAEKSAKQIVTEKQQMLTCPTCPQEK